MDWNSFRRPILVYQVLGNDMHILTLCHNNFDTFHTFSPFPIRTMDRRVWMPSLHDETNNSAKGKGSYGSSRITNACLNSIYLTHAATRTFRILREIDHLLNSRVIKKYLEIEQSAHDDREARSSGVQLRSSLLTRLSRCIWASGAGPAEGLDKRLAQGWLAHSAIWALSGSILSCKAGDRASSWEPRLRWKKKRRAIGRFWKIRFKTVHCSVSWDYAAQWNCAPPPPR